MSNTRDNNPAIKLDFQIVYTCFTSFLNSIFGGGMLGS